MYAITDEGVNIVSLKYFWRAVFQGVLFRSFVQKLIHGGSDAHVLK